MSGFKSFRDYDVVIFMLTSIESSDIVDWDGFINEMKPRRTFEMVGHQGTVVVVGDPRLMIGGENQTPAESTRFTIASPFLYWTGARFQWDESPGDTIRFDHSKNGNQYSGYVQHIKRWEYSLQGCSIEITPKMSPENRKFEEHAIWKLNVDHICQSRYGTAVAFDISFALYAPPHTKQLPPNHIYSSGKIVFLPPSDLCDDDALVIILKDLFQIELSVPEPQWIQEIIAPGQRPVDEEIVSLLKSLDEFNAELDVKRNRREEIRSSLKLLYGIGFDLEDAVRDILQRLGATVEAPNDPGKEDGWLSVNVQGTLFEGVLEVKGTRNSQFDEGGLRQLQEWKTRGVELRKKKYKGIFIGANQIETPAEDRAPAFSDSWTKNAALFENVAIMAEEIYAAYSLHQEGLLDLDRFWLELFDTNGIYECGLYNRVKDLSDDKH